MSRVIKSYSKLHVSLQEEIYIGYLEGELERTTLPYKGQITDGVIYKGDDVIYLIPISTIVAGRSGSSDDLDDDESNSIDIEKEEDIEEDIEEDLEDEELIE